MGKQAEVSVPQRCEAVLKLLRREEPAAQIARRLGVSEPTLYRWRDDFLAGGQAALGSGKGRAIGGTGRSRTFGRSWTSGTR